MSILLVLLACSCVPKPPPAEPPPPASAATGREVVRSGAGPQLGVNFVRFAAPPGVVERRPDGHPEEDWSMSSADVAASFAKLGVGAMRQLTTADVTWRSVEPSAGTFEWRPADAVLDAPPAEPIVTLFELQYASPNPPWLVAADPFRRRPDADATDYVTQVVTRYRDHVRYWEIGNEMDHWRAVTQPPPNPALAAQTRKKMPANVPRDGWSPEEQGRFFADVAKLVRELDPDAVVVMPGMSSPAPEVTDGWLEPFVRAAGKDSFDVVNYHTYAPWPRLPRAREALGEKLAALGLSDKPVWCTETGATSDGTLTQRTDYPNSPEEQAADVWRRALLAWAGGDQLVLWHSWLDSPDNPNNTWRGYGLVGRDGQPKPSWQSYALLAHELVPWKAVRALEEGDRYVLRVDRDDGHVRWVAWGRGSWRLPDGAAKTTSVVVPDGLSPAWTPATPGASIDLTDIPTLVAD